MLHGYCLGVATHGQVIMQVAESIELFVPGRVCLFGEHSDWAGGYRTVDPTIPTGQTIICGTDTGIHARVSAHPDRLVLRSTVNGKVVSAEIETNPDALLRVAAGGGHWSYIAGVAYQIRKAHPNVGGLILDNYLTDMPVRKGLSSSAAVSVLTARAFNQVYDLGLTIEDEMEYAYLGEITTPSQCGRMDQGCAFGQTPIRMQFDGDKMSAEPLAVGGDVYMVVVDLCAGKDTTRILSDLRACYPATDGHVAGGLRYLLGELNHGIISSARQYLAMGEVRGLGELMTAAQAMFDLYAGPACPTQLRSPVLHALLKDERIAPFVWGGKGVGSQGDGAAQFIARSHIDQQALVQLINDEFGMHAMAMTIRPNQAPLRTPDLLVTSA